MTEPNATRDIPIPFGPESLPSPWKTDDLVRFSLARGTRVFEFREHAWTMSKTRFCVPLAWWLPLPIEHIGWPSYAALGFQSAVSEPSRANARITLLGVSGLSSYGPHMLSKTRRWEVRRSLANLDVRILNDEGLLVDQGWDVLSAAAARSKQWTPPDKTSYQNLIRASFASARPLVVAVVHAGKLQAYAVSFAYHGVAFLSDVVVPPAARTTGAGAALYWIHLSMWAQASGVDQFTLGRTIREKPTLDDFKKSMGSREHAVPVVSRMREPVKSYLRRSRPLTYERLYGVPLEVQS